MVGDPVGLHEHIATRLREGLVQCRYLEIRLWIWGGYEAMTDTRGVDDCVIPFVRRSLEGKREASCHICTRTQYIVNKQVLLQPPFIGKYGFLIAVRVVAQHPANSSLVRRDRSRRGCIPQVPSLPA
jgi:hypothetical protein